MTPEDQQKIQDLMQKVQDLTEQVSELTEWKKARELQQISIPVDDASRIAMGIGFIATDSATTPTGAIIVNSNQGPIKLLVA